MFEQMPKPEELLKIQKEYLSDEQIEKDTIREEAYNAGEIRGQEKILNLSSNQFSKIKESQEKEALKLSKIEKDKKDKIAHDRVLKIIEEKGIKNNDEIELSFVDPDDNIKSYTSGYFEELDDRYFHYKAKERQDNYAMPNDWIESIDKVEQK